MSSPEYSSKGIRRIGRLLHNRVSSGVDFSERVIDAGISNVGFQIRTIKEDVHEDIPFIPLDPISPTDSPIEYNLKRGRLILKGVVRENIEVVKRISVKTLIRDIKRSVKA